MSDDRPTPDFAALLAPISVEEFFDDYHGTQPLFLPGAADKFRGVMCWDLLNQVLNMTSVWSSRTLRLVANGTSVPPEQYCTAAVGRDQADVLQPDAAKVQQIVSDGASLVADSVDHLNPGLMALAETLERALSAKLQCNLYYSLKQRQAFRTHYDTHDVYALHCEGEKVWRVYEGRADRPVNHASFIRLPQQTLDEARGAVLMEVTMSPGDLLYLPRGQYHDALASSASSLHVTYGATHVLGIDLMSILTEVAIHDAEFRRELPHPRLGRDALRAHVVKLLERLQQLNGNEQFIDDLVQYQQDFRYPRGGFALPVHSREVQFERAGTRASIVRRNGAEELTWSGGVAAVPPQSRAPISWIIAKPRFLRSDLQQAFAKRPDTELDQLLEDLQQMGLIARAGED